MAKATHVNLGVPMRAWDVGGESWEFRANNRAFYELEKAYNFTLPFSELVNLQSLMTDRLRILWAMSATYRATKNPCINTFEEFCDALPVGEKIGRIWESCFGALEEAFGAQVDEPDDLDEDEDPDEDAEGNETPAPSEPDQLPGPNS